MQNTFEVIQRCVETVWSGVLRRGALLVADNIGYLYLDAIHEINNFVYQNHLVAENSRDIWIDSEGNSNRQRSENC